MKYKDDVTQHKKGQDITQEGLAIRSSEDIIDAAHYGGGVRQVPAVIQGS